MSYCLSLPRRPQAQMLNIHRKSLHLLLHFLAREKWAEKQEKLRKKMKPKKKTNPKNQINSPKKYPTKPLLWLKLASGIG